MVIDVKTVSLHRFKIEKPHRSGRQHINFDVMNWSNAKYAIFMFYLILIGYVLFCYYALSKSLDLYSYNH